MRPLVGLSSYREPARWGVWDQRADLLPVLYADAVALAGGVPVLLPPADRDLADEAVARLDALVVSGGADVDPSTYGATADSRTDEPRRDRDAWELALLDAAVARDLPVLGVCRGMQVMAVHAGGELVQHLPDVVGHEQHSPGGDQFGTVEVRVAPDTLLARLVGDHPSAVHCHHHQAVRSHPGYAAVAWADDGSLEAIEAPGRFRLGVQWHPEVAVDAGLFTGLVTAASPGGHQPDGEGAEHQA